MVILLPATKRSFSIFSLINIVFPTYKPYVTLPSRVKSFPAINDIPSIVALWVTSFPATNLAES